MIRKKNNECKVFLACANETSENFLKARPCISAIQLQGDRLSY